VADERRIRASPDGQPEGVDQQALPGPCLAGEDVEPGLEREPQPVDQREVVDRELK